MSATRLAAALVMLVLGTGLALVAGLVPVIVRGDRAAAAAIGMGMASLVLLGVGAAVVARTGP